MKQFRKMLIMSLFLVDGVISVSGVFAKERILVLFPEGEEFQAVLKGIANVLDKRFSIHEMKIKENTIKDDVVLKISKTKPKLLLLMDNRAISLLKEYQQGIPDSMHVIPSISCMVAFVESEIEGLRNATGIAYEVPIVTSVVDFRYISSKPIQKVGILHRELINDFIDKNIKYCQRENIEIRKYTIPDTGVDFKYEVRRGLKILLKNQNVDALWVPNDMALLQHSIIKEAWMPMIEKYKKPAIVCVENLMKLGLGTFAVVPDHDRLGRQVTDKIYEAKQNGWYFKQSAVEPPLSVLKIIFLAKARKQFELKEKHLENYYVIPSFDSLVKIILINR